MGRFSKTKTADSLLKDDLPGYPKKLSPEFSSALRTFSFWVTNGSVALPLLEGVDYRPASEIQALQIR